MRSEQEFILELLVQIVGEEVLAHGLDLDIFPRRGLDIVEVNRPRLVRSGVIRRRACFRVLGGRIHGGRIHGGRIGCFPTGCGLVLFQRYDLGATLSGRLHQLGIIQTGARRRRIASRIPRDFFERYRVRVDAHRVGLDFVEQRGFEPVRRNYLRGRADSDTGPVGGFSAGRLVATGNVVVG